MSQVKQHKKNVFKAVTFGIFIGAFLMFMASYTLLNTMDTKPISNNAKAENTPLYWVAPMDANYRRDKPGKSPMGMDLVPVYENQGGGEDEGIGTIKVSSNVVNNLGVRTVEVSYRTLSTEINTLGYVTYDQDKLVHIHPRVEGWIEKLHVKSIGEQIKKGQALYEIYSPALVNAQEEFLLALDRGNSRLISAAHNRLMALQLPVSTINELKQTKQVQSRITFYAPQNGVVENLKIREGFFVKPGSTLMSIADLSEVWIEGEVFERQASQVKSAMPATITLDYLPGKTWQGKVDYIYPMLNLQTRTVKVRLRIKNLNNEFKPNMFVQLVLHNQDDENTLQIPKEALIRTGKQDRVVLALGHGSFKSIAVQVGRYSGDYVEILHGLKSGDKVVSSAQFLLDSESSKSSDFKRMTPVKMNSEHPEDADSMARDDKEISDTLSATATGKVNSLMVDHGMINISRSAITKWGRPAATVDFISADGISLAGIKVGDNVEFTFEVRDNNFVITKIVRLTEVLIKQEPSADHSNH